MVLNNINLINFRNYSKQSIKLCDNINILIGDNAQGKTNILEAIYVLAFTKSHRAIIDNNLIMNQEDFCKIKGDILANNIKSSLEFFLSNNEKKVFIDGINIKKFMDYVSKFKVVIFSPDNLEIIKSSPSVRRNFLNTEISQIDKLYLYSLNDYNKYVKARNEFLKNMYKNNNNNNLYLSILNEKIIEKAVYIYKKRMEFIDDLNKIISKIYFDITGYQNLSIKYDNKLGVNMYNEDKIRSILVKKFEGNYERDILTCSTNFGPHKDDFSFYLSDADLKIFGSQGQHRSAVLSLKLSEIEIFKNKICDTPILLLDDVFSELDDTKKNNLIKYVNCGIQTIITTTDIKEISEELLENSYIYEIKDGKAERKMVYGK